MEGHKATMLGAVERDGAYYGRTVLGRTFLKVILDKNIERIEGAVRAVVAPGSIV